MVETASLTYTQPLLLVFLAIAVIGLLRIPPSTGKRLAIAGIAGIFLASWPPADWLFSRPLQGQYPVRPFETASQLQAIVVLGESVRPPQFEEPYPLAGSTTYRRCEYAAWIYRRYGPLPVLVSGGRESSASPPVSATMRELLRRDGIPESMIWTEDRSRSTHENAVDSTMILREHGVSRVALVVDATSMPRAAACFRKLQVDVTPAPCDFDTLELSQDELLPGWLAVRRNEDTLHEMLGLVWYRMRGWV
jgi:uncharacterized SAM-binding protein YcdF (DUF218 family)